jgi:ribosomal-protein-alanine N-acetyltransferase
MSLLPPPTERLTFRRWREGDLALAQALWGDPAVTRFISHAPWTALQIQDRLAFELRSACDFGVQYWPAFLKADGSFVGCCGLRSPALTQAANTHRYNELGFHLVPSQWGKGLATEAARSAVSLAFDELRANALFAGHHPENHSSRRVLEKLGFRFVGTALYEPTGLQHLSYHLKLPAGGRSAGVSLDGPPVLP